MTTRQRVVVATVVAALGVFAIDAVTPSAVTMGVLYSALLVMTLWSPQPWDTVVLGVIFGVLDGAGYWLSLPHADEWTSVNRALSILTVLITAMALFFWRRRQGGSTQVLEHIVLRLLRSRGQRRRDPLPRRGNRWRDFWSR